MTERVCRNCRWFRKDRFCWRYPEANTTTPDAACGEWADAGVTPEQEDLQKLTRQFALAILSAEWGGDLSDDGLWTAAKNMAAAEPQIQRENEQ
jgi:hypothetical protein